MVIFKPLLFTVGAVSFSWDIALDKGFNSMTQSRINIINFNFPIFYYLPNPGKRHKDRRINTPGGQAGTTKTLLRALRFI